MKPTHSPWGQVDHCTKLEEGLYWVSTPGHGGLMIGIGLANQVLSLAARLRGEDYGTWLCYEEDCAYAIAFWEINPELLLPLYNFRGAERTWTAPQIHQQLFETLSSWEPDYLLAVGVQPDPERYARYLERQQEMAAWQQR